MLKNAFFVFFFRTFVDYLFCVEVCNYLLKFVNKLELVSLDTNSITNAYHTNILYDLNDYILYSIHLIKLAFNISSAKYM